MTAFISLVCLFRVSSLSLTNENVFVRNYKVFLPLLFWFSPPSAWGGTESGLILVAGWGQPTTNLSTNID